MAKSNTVKIRLNSEGNTGYFYVTRKNTKSANKNLAEKLTFRKYDPKLRKHVEFKEGKIK